MKVYWRCLSRSRLSWLGLLAAWRRRHLMNGHEACLGEKGKILRDL
jgi:hypothetical protein